MFRGGCRWQRGAKNEFRRCASPVVVSAVSFSELSFRAFQWQCEELGSLFQRRLTMDWLPNTICKTRWESPTSQVSRLKSKREICSDLHLYLVSFHWQTWAGGHFKNRTILPSGAGCYRVNDSIEYYSVSHGAQPSVYLICGASCKLRGQFQDWLPATVVKVDSEGRIIVDLKWNPQPRLFASVKHSHGVRPNTWISKEVGQKPLQVLTRVPTQWQDQAKKVRKRRDGQPLRYCPVPDAQSISNPITHTLHTHSHAPAWPFRKPLRGQSCSAALQKVCKRQQR